VADRALPRARAVSLVEEQVQHLMDAVEPVDELAVAGRIEHDTVLDEIAGGALQALLDRLLGYEQSSRHLRVPESAQRRQGERDLVGPVETGMAAREHHPQLAVLDLRVDEELVDADLDRRARGGPLLRGPLARPAAPQRVEDLVPRHL